MVRNVFLILFLIQLVSCTYDRYSKFVTAVQRNDFKKVEALIEEGIEVSGSMYNKQPLQIAVENDSIEMFNFLIENGADIKWDNFRIIEFLVNSYGKKYLEELVKRKCITTQFRILSKGYSIFYWASMQQDPKFIVGINDGKQNFNEVYNEVPVLKNLIDNFDENTLDDIIPDGIRDSDYNTEYLSPLGYALAKNKIKTAVMLIDKGLSFDMLDENPWMYIGIHWLPDYDTIINQNDNALISIRDADSGLLSGYIFNNNYTKEDRFRLIERAIAAGVSPNKPDREGRDTWGYISGLGSWPSLDPVEGEDEEYRAEQKKYANEIRVFLESIGVKSEIK